MRPGLAGPQIRDPLGLGLREGAHGDTELAPSFTRPPPPNPARSSASEPASTGVCVCVRVPLRPPQGSAPRSQPTLNFSPGKPGKLKGAVAVRVGVCVGGGGRQCGTQHLGQLRHLPIIVRERLVAQKQVTESVPRRQGQHLRVPVVHC